MNELYTHEASGATLYKPVMRADVTRFDEIFDAATEYDAPDAPKSRSWIGDGTRPPIPVGPYCPIRKLGGGHGSLAVSCRDWVLSEIDRNMLAIDNDSLHFGIVEHEGGWSLVYVSYNVIIGDRWLAYIKTDTIPSTD